MNILKINTVEDFTNRYGIPSTGHPLLSISRIAGTNEKVPKQQTIQVYLYAIIFKQGVSGLSVYGWRDYDFKKGLLNFFAPGQILHWDESIDLSKTQGWMVVFHPDFIRKHTLANKIDKYKFFSYDTNEALHISDAEKLIVENIFENIEREANNNLDDQSQDIILSQIDLILNYAERFYKRQFRTRFSVESDIVSRFQTILHKHFENPQNKLITAGDLAAELSMSTSYLSELLRNLTGMSTQQHIHAYVIDHAKTLLLTTSLSISEIAYRLGFEYPGYFNRLFKSKTGHTPVAFRSLN